MEGLLGGALVIISLPLVLLVHPVGLVVTTLASLSIWFFGALRSGQKLNPRALGKIWLYVNGTAWIILMMPTLFRVLSGKPLF